MNNEINAEKAREISKSKNFNYFDIAKQEAISKIKESSERGEFTTLVDIPKPYEGDVVDKFKGWIKGLGYNVNGETKMSLLITW